MNTTLCHKIKALDKKISVLCKEQRIPENKQQMLLLMKEVNELKSQYLDCI